MKKIARKTYYVLIACILLCLSLLGCDVKNKPDDNYNFKEYAVPYGDINLHLDSTYKSDFGEDNIILVHGLTYSSHEFDINYKDYSLVRFLADKGYTVWRLDIAGYGQSDRPYDGFVVDSDYAADNIYCAVKEICELTGKSKIDVLGWSWGTVTTSRFVSNHSEMVDKLILYAPIVSGLGENTVETDYHKNSWENAVGDFQLNSDGTIDESIVESAVVEYFGSSCWRYDGESSPNGPRRDICVDESVTLIDMSKIGVKTLLIYGNADPYLNYELIDKMYQELPKGSMRKIIVGAAHCAYIEKPYYHDFQNTVIKFLK
ncbi:MAG: alpha/beta hydrolase [Lachnospiraceae bacterium]|nr:alpha/beta hydrolase [Lachnospiraceae bacterium]